MIVIETIHAHTQILAVGGLFSSATDLIWATMGFLGAAALLMGTLSAIGKVKKEGTGAGITSQLGAIVFGVLVVLSAGISAMVTHEANNHGIRNTVHVDSPWGQ
jgi:hypothetical protein